MVRKGRLVMWMKRVQCFNVVDKVLKLDPRKLGIKYK